MSTLTMRLAQEKEPLEARDWVADELIPVDWKYSFTLKSQPDRKNGFKRLFKFKTETGLVLRSAWQAIQHIKEDKKYTRRHLENMIEFVKNNKKQERDIFDHTVMFCVLIKLKKN